MNDIPTPSLLPYLESDKNNFRLDISLISRDPLFLEKSPFPFSLISDSAPFERLLEAHIVTDADSVIRRVFLLQQSDEYRYTPDEMWPMTNEDINRRWIDTFERYSSRSGTGGSKPIFLAEQINKNGAFLPFQPLFYCVFKEVYFHPPCPDCGHFLKLCKDNKVLVESNLPSHATSLARFLYCPDCLQTSGKTEFYVSARQGSDPAALKDRWALVNAFGNLILKSGASDHFPCLDCPERTTCYGTDNRVISRLVPYSFYPFYVFVFEAETLNAPDFLSLVSGASVDALKAHLSAKKATGRLSCLEAFEQNRSAPSNFLFGSETEKSFLEILYLKLSFLGALIREIFSGSDPVAYFDYSLSLDRVWIRVADQAGLLPHFWNFKINILDLWTNSIKQPHIAKLPSAYGQHFLGNVWFYTLLVNGRQSVDQVRAELDKYVSELSAQDKGFLEIIHTTGFNPVFAPENLFWNPEAKDVRQNWRIFWDKSLDLGADLLAASIHPERKWSADVFWQNFETLRTDIKTELFGQAPLATQAEHPDEDAEISNVLKRLLVKWRSQAQPPAAAAASEEIETVMLSEPQSTQSLTETVIVSPHTPVEEPAASMGPADEEETLILPPKQRSNQKTPEAETPDDEIFQETVILSRGGSAEQPRSSALRDSDMDKGDLPETVLISPDEQPGDRSKSVVPTAFQDHLSKVSKPSPGERKPPENKSGKKAEPPDEDDILAETVILRPDKDKGKGPENA